MQWNITQSLKRMNNAICSNRGGPGSYHTNYMISVFPGGSDGKASACNVGDPGWIPGLGRSGEGNGNLLQYSCLENPTDGGAW